jgi:CubicO group peptidase (beta-lactamase class C family)
VYGVASVTKTLTSLVFHALPLDPATPAHTLLPSTWVGGDARKRTITLAHLLTMSSGLDPHDNPAVDNYLNSILFARTTVANPGERWAYASVPVDLLSVALQRATGKRTRQLFNELVARKIGIPDIAWQSIGSYLPRLLWRFTHGPPARSCGADDAERWLPRERPRPDARAACGYALAGPLARDGPVSADTRNSVPNPAGPNLATIVLPAGLEQPCRHLGAHGAARRLLCLGLGGEVSGGVSVAPARRGAARRRGAQARSQLPFGVLQANSGRALIDEVLVELVARAIAG